MSDRFARLSPSSLGVMEQCKRSWAIQRDYKSAREAHDDLPDDPPTIYMYFGTIFHLLVERGVRTFKSMKKIVKEVLDDAPADLQFNQQYPDAEAIAKGARTALISFLASPESRPWKQRDGLVLEKKLEAEVEGMHIAGIVDCVDSDGVVRDLKTTSASNTDWHGSQISCYHLLAEENGYEVGDQAAVVKVVRPRGPSGSSGVKAEHFNARANRSHVIRLIKDAKEIRDSREDWFADYTSLPINPSASRCRYCPARATSACPETRAW